MMTLPQQLIFLLTTIDVVLHLSALSTIMYHIVQPRNRLRHL